MYHAEPICLNPITGRRVWLLREIPSGHFGDAWVSSLVVVRARWFNRSAELLMAESISTTQRYRAVRKALKLLGFNTAFALRHGRKKRYFVQDARKFTRGK